jgi:hypothetical protein
LYDYFEGNLKLIDKDVLIPPHINSDNTELTYVTKGNEIVIYKILDGYKVFLGRFSGIIRNVFIFPDNNHLAINTDSALKICDFDFVNCVKILDTQNYVIFPVKSEYQFLSLGENIIKSYTFRVD